MLRNKQTTAEKIKVFLEMKKEELGVNTFTFRARNISTDRSEVLSAGQWLGIMCGTIVFNEFKLTAVSWSRKKGHLYRATFIDDDYLY